ncbi:MAG: hypothetical protein R3A13_07445 [Bdellovibrionota bacterium]
MNPTRVTCATPTPTPTPTEVTPTPTPTGMSATECDGLYSGWF